MVKSAWLDDRGLIKVGGSDAVPFLQGLISNDVTKVAPGRAIYAALLTPQGKYLHDFFITAYGEDLILDCEAPRREDLYTRLRRYRLRSKVELTDVTDDWAVMAAWGNGCLEALDLSEVRGAATALGDGTAYTDPRHTGLGARILVPVTEKNRIPAVLEPAPRADYERLRLSLGVPSGPVELPVDRAFLLESGFDELNGIDWQKGCYVGQEVTARTKYRGLLRRRLVPVTIAGTLPADDTRIMAEGRDVGEIRSSMDGQGLALIRLESLDSGKTLYCGEATITAHVPDWWTAPDAKSGAAGTAD